METVLFETESTQNRQEELEKLENRCLVLLFGIVISFIAVCLVHRAGTGSAVLISLIVLAACLIALLIISMIGFFTLDSQEQSSLCITPSKLSGVPVLFDGREPVEALISDIVGFEKMDDSRVRIHTLQESYTFFTGKSEEVCQVLDSILMEPSRRS